MDQFLAQVEQRAFNIARLSVGNRDDALDIVQDAMIATVTRYAERPAAEWRPLFYRVLQNRIRDHYRRQSVWRRWFLPGAQGPSNAPEAVSVPEAAAPAVSDPAQRSSLDESVAALEAGLAALPERQRQIYLLRELEGMSVAEAARAAGCSVGSVKTHFHRARQALRSELKEYWA